MMKTPRRRNVPSRVSSSKKRTLHLSRETIRTLTADELPQAVGGSDTACPTGSWPSDTTLGACVM